MRLMGRMGPMVLAALFFVMGAEALVACSATSVVDAARQSKDSDAWRAAQDVATEELDRAGVQTDVSSQLTGPGYSITATPMEAAVSTLLVEAGAKGMGSTSEMGYGVKGFTHAVTTSGVTPDDFRKLLDEPSAGYAIGQTHAPDSTVRNHLLRHAREYEQGALSTSTPPVSSAPPSYQPPQSYPAPPTISAPVPAPAPAAPAVDHAG